MARDVGATSDEPRSMRPGRWIPHDRTHRIALLLLLLLVGIGVLLRILVTKAQTPGFIAFSDSAYYLIAAHTNPFQWAAEPPGGNPWPAGYPVFLRLVYTFDERVSAVVALQHLIGITTGLLWFSTMRRVISPLWALVPAAVVLLAGPQIFIEHAPLAEALFSLLVALMAYGAVRALEGKVIVWGALAGASAAGAACVRVLGVLLIGIVAVWLFASVEKGLRRRVTAAVACLAAAALLIGGYLVEMKRETGYGGPFLTRAGSWGAPATSTQSDRSYLDRVTHDLTRYWRSADEGFRGGYSYDGFVRMATQPVTVDVLFSYPYLTQREQTAGVHWWYETVRAEIGSSGLRARLLEYEQWTRLEDIRFLLLLVGAICGVALARAGRRSVGVLMLVVAAALILTPIFYVYFDARYLIPGYGPLAAAAAIGASALWERVSARRNAVGQVSSSAKPARLGTAQTDALVSPVAARLQAGRLR